MRLYTSQGAKVADNIAHAGQYVCDIEKSAFKDDDNFRRAYDWLAKALAERIEKPTCASYPVWAYRELGENFDYTQQGSEGEERVFLELEIPDNQVVAIDPVKWFDLIACGFVCPPDIDEEEYDRLSEKYAHATEEELNANRQQVFDVDEGNIPEMLFWAIDAANLVSATRYVCRISQFD
jgi:hypothetical protein